MAGEKVRPETPNPTLEASFSFDEDEGTTATDGASDDGRQQARFHNRVRVAPDPDPSAPGGAALHFGGDGDTLDTFEIVGTSHLGGSDFIMIFQEKAGFVLDAPKEEENSQSYKHLLMGERIGYLNPY